MHKTLIQTLLAAFCAILATAPLEGGGVMLIGMRNALLSGGNAPEKYILKLENGMDLRCNAMLPDGDMTIALWYKGYSRGAHNEVYQFGWRDYLNNWGGSRAQFSTSGYHVRYATGSSSSAYSITSAGAYATDQKWHHFACRKSGATFSVIVDGSVVLAATTAAHKNDGTPLSIGSLGNDSDSQPRRGVKSIGFFCLFGRALNDGEISRLASARKLKPSGGLFTDMICGYELSSDTLLADVTGNYPLTMYNAYGETVEYTDLLP